MTRDQHPSNPADRRGGFWSTLVIVCLVANTGIAAPFQQRSSLAQEYPASSPLHRDTGLLQDNRAIFEAERFHALQPPPRAVPRKAPILRSIRDRLDATGRQRGLLYEKIDDRLDRLQELLSRRSEIVAEPVRPLMPPLPAKIDQTPVETTPLAPIPIVDPDLTQTPVPESPAAEQQPQPTPVPLIITESAVDRLALADSLFGSDQFEIALKLYLELNATERDPGMQTWIRYQVAACSRRLHNYDQARKYYRIVAGDKSDGLYPKLARWWLELIQKRIAYEELQNDLRAQLNLPEKADDQQTK